MPIAVQQTVDTGILGDGGPDPSRVGLLVALAAASLTACTSSEGERGEATTAPAACVDVDDAARDGVGGTPVWARFCPGPERATLPAEVPSDALTSHLDLLAGLAERDAEDAPAGTVVVAVVLQSLIVCVAGVALCALMLRLHRLRLRDAGLRWTRASLPGLLAGLTVGAVVVVQGGEPGRASEPARQHDGVQAGVSQQRGGPAGR